MTHPASQPLPRHIVLTGMLCTVLAGCAPADRHTTLIASRSPSQALYRVAQLGHGDTRHFGICLEPACPHVNVKSPPLPAAPAPSTPETEP